MSEEKVIYLGDIFHFNDTSENENKYTYIKNGALCVCNGRILDCGKSSDILSKYSDAKVVDFQGRILMPGFIDAHVHYVQTEIIGMYGKQLLDWLNLYTFPAEQAFENTDHCRQISQIFLKELFKNGVTTCSAYGSVHPQATDILFEEASKQNMCIMAGKVLMDREAPDYLCDTPQTADKDVRNLIEKWHGKGRNRYVITPRFAISCTPEELDVCRMIHEDYPDTYIQTHLSENRNEIAFVKRLFPDCPDYLSVYESFGLLTDRTLLAHGIHLSDSECERISKVKAIVVHCPTSNNFLGSGLYDMQKANKFNMQTVMGTDVGAGTTFSMFQTLGASYQVQQLNGYPMSAFEAFYKATLGSAHALQLDQEIGNFQTGKYADFIVVDYQSTQAQQARYKHLVESDLWNVENMLFGLMTQADDRAIKATYIAGRCVHKI